MEQDILTLLYYGKIVPWENNNDQSSIAQKLRDRIDEDIHNLSAMLPEDAKAVLDRLLENRSELADIAACGAFKDGFRLGAQFTLDTFCGSKQP